MSYYQYIDSSTVTGHVNIGYCSTVGTVRIHIQLKSKTNLNCKRKLFFLLGLIYNLCIKMIPTERQTDYIYKNT